ncbi:MAG: DMT family transporter [Gemmobacter sp.]|jgi:drug/metabolite transporter (DMT)-like permease|nr:DMT family transporter [Gemmobacter sp.]
MIELWVPITLASAFLQNLRSTAQKHLKGVMGTTGATFARFGFGMPFALLFVALLHWGPGHPLPNPNAGFFGWVVVGGISQIAATFLLVHLFSFRNFAVGTAYSRTEPAQAAVFGLLFLGEVVTAGTLMAITISVVGVMLISVARVAINPRALMTSILAPTALIGLLSGTCFGLSAVAYRGASLALGGPNFMMQSAFTLSAVTLFQTVLMLGWIVLRDPAELRRIGTAWKPSLFVGFVGALGSFGWFAAMTLREAAVVKALAQVEMIFTFASSAFFFKERINRFEIAGCVLIAFGVLALILFR